MSMILFRGFALSLSLFLVVACGDGNRSPMGLSDESVIEPAGKLTVSVAPGEDVVVPDSSGVVADSTLATDIDSTLVVEAINVVDLGSTKLRFFNTRLPVSGSGGWVNMRIDGSTSAVCEVEATSSTQEVSIDEIKTLLVGGDDGYWLVAVPIPTFYLEEDTSKEWKVSWTDGVSVIDTVFVQSSARLPAPVPVVIETPPTISVEAPVEPKPFEAVDIGPVHVEPVDDLGSISVEPVVEIEARAPEVQTVVKEPIEVGIKTAVEIEPDVLQMTNEFMFVWGYLNIDGLPASVGTVIEAIGEDGQLVGCFETTNLGGYGAMGVYAKTPEDDGVEQGELVSLYVDGTDSGVSFKYTSFGDVIQRDIDIVSSSQVEPFEVVEIEPVEDGFSEWRMPIFMEPFVSEETDSRSIGQDSHATDGYDYWYENDRYPPMPPLGMREFGLLLECDGVLERFENDIRSSQSRDMEFSLRFQLGEDSLGQASFSWDTSQLPSDATGEVAFILTGEDGEEIDRQTYANIWDGKVTIQEGSWAMNQEVVMFVIHRGG